MGRDAGWVAELRRFLIGQGVENLGLPPTRWSRWLVGLLFGLPIHRFARIGTHIDDWTVRYGVVGAGQQILRRYVAGYRVCGAEHVPKSGPLLIAANHPGTYDAVITAVGAQRDDLKIVVGELPFLRGLPAVREHLVYIERGTQGQTAALRASLRHLEGGGALLIFPTGQMDPDPEFMSGAYDALGLWSPSVALMLRRVPATQLILAIVSGVLMPRYMRGPLVLLGKTTVDRQIIGASVQVADQALFQLKLPLVPKVSFGEPVPADELIALHGRRMTGAIVERARHLLAQHQRVCGGAAASLRTLVHAGGEGGTYPSG